MTEVKPASDALIEAMKMDMLDGCDCPNYCIQYSCQDIKELIARIESDRAALAEAVTVGSFIGSASTFEESG